MKEYDKAARAASIDYNTAIQTGDYEEAIKQLSILIKIAEEEERPNDRSNLEHIRSYIEDLFNIGREADKISSTETKRAEC